MGKEKLKPLLWQDPLGEGELYISELTSDESGLVIRGRFAIPRYAKLDEEQARLLEVFLRCRGTVTLMERELGLSYPTVRARIDGLLEALGLSPVKDDGAKKDRAQEKDRVAEQRAAIIAQLEAGEIDAATAKLKLRELGTGGDEGSETE